MLLHRTTVMGLAAMILECVALVCYRFIYCLLCRVHMYHHHLRILS